MTLGEIIVVLRQHWWLVLIVPAIALTVGIAQMARQPYVSTVRATVLIPGDTEIPGSSERPELMVLDDLSPFVESIAFADGVHDRIEDPDISPEDVRGALSGSRYSRVLTLQATSGDAAEAKTIAAAAEAALPDLINAYLMPDSGERATVRVIDPASEPSMGRSGNFLRLAVLGMLGLLAGAFLAVGIEWSALASGNTANQPLASDGSPSTPADSK